MNLAMFNWVAWEKWCAVLRKKLNTEVKCVILGHAQRGGKPSVIDRILPQLQALKAVEWLDKDRLVS